MTVNWGLAGGNNALAMFDYGAKLGQNLQDRRDQRDERNALLQIRQKETDARIADQQADNRLQQQKFDTEQVEAGRKAVANAAFDIYQTPPEQRAAKWDAYVTRFNMPELVGQYSDQRLNEVVAQAGLQQQFQQFQRPEYTPVPYESTLVNLRDPQAVQQFQGGGATAQQAQAAPAGTDQFTPDMWRANVAAMGREKATEWATRNGVPIPIASDPEYDALPSGATFRAPDGTIRRKP